MDRTAVAKVENGTRRVTALELDSIARALNVRIDSLLREPVPAVVAYRTALDPDAPTAASTMDISPASELDFQGDVEQLASYARQLMNVDSVAPIPHLADAALTVGVLFSLDLGPNAPEAASAPVDTWGVAVVNGSLKVDRRRLAAAHDLGHLLAGNGYRV